MTKHYIYFSVLVIVCFSLFAIYVDVNIRFCLQSFDIPTSNLFFKIINILSLFKYPEVSTYVEAVVEHFRIMLGFFYY